MSDETKERDLGRRVTACKGWRWVPGMLTEAGYRILDGQRTSEMVLKTRGYESWEEHGIIDEFDFPDLSDPCTVGGMVHLIQERHDRGPVYVVLGSCWEVHAQLPRNGRKTTLLALGSTKELALIKALGASI